MGAPALLMLIVNQATVNQVYSANLHASTFKMGHLPKVSMEILASALTTRNVRLSYASPTIVSPTALLKPYSMMDALAQIISNALLDIATTTYAHLIAKTRLPLDSMLMDASALTVKSVSQICVQVECATLPAPSTRPKETIATSVSAPQDRNVIQLTV